MAVRETPATCVAVLGLGEAGGAIARDLVVAGARVRAYDPEVRPDGDMVACADEANAARGADIVLSVNSAEAAVQALRAGVPGVGEETVWADLNTGSPALKRELDTVAGDRDVAFVDVALMAPVPGNGISTPMLASGGAAGAYARAMGALGAVVTTADGPAGTAATRKLLRSVFFKGMAAAVVEALRASRQAGLEEWMRAHIADELTRADSAFAQRLETGSYTHAERREEEMRAAAELLAELDVAPRVSEASRQLLGQLHAESSRGSQGPSRDSRDAGGASPHAAPVESAPQDCQQEL